MLMAYILQHFAAVGALQPHTEKAPEKRDRERAAMLLGFVDARLAELRSRARIHRTSKSTIAS